jgi:DNA-binding NarL/FixJ family response regulator
MPDVLIMDLDGLDGDQDGIRCLRRARGLLPDLRVIVISAHDDPGWIDEAFAAGAFAYLPTTARVEDFDFVMRQALEHSIHLATRVTASPASTDHGSCGGLTAREGEILQLVAEGRSNAEVARLLWVSQATVKFHLARICQSFQSLSGSRTTATSANWARSNAHGVRLPPCAAGR